MNATTVRISQLAVALFLSAAAAVAQEEADRPVGEVTDAMLKRVPPQWVGAGGEAGAMTDEMARRHSALVLPAVFPTPQEVYGSGRQIGLGSAEAPEFAVELCGEALRLPLIETELRRRISGGDARHRSAGGPRFVFALSAADLPVERERLASQLATVSSPEAYIVHCTQEGDRDLVLVLGRSEAALWRAVPTLAQLVRNENGVLRMPAVEIVDYPLMHQRGLLVDIGGQGFMVGPARWEYPRWKEFVDWMVDQKLNQLWLEIIGSGRLMGNLDPEKGEWIGFPVDLKSYPQLVCRDRPIRRWDEARGKVVEDTYTAPNVRHDFLRELIDYAQARGIKCVLFIGYDYFANQLPYVLGVPANDPSDRRANRVYDTILEEVVRRYDNASGVIFHTIENKSVPPSMVDEVARRAHEGRGIVKSIHPGMDVGVLNDYLEWRPREEFERYARVMPSDVYQVYSPHVPPQNKSWKRVYGDVFRYQLFSQYAWDHIPYVFPENVQHEIRDDYLNGYRKVVSQAWYFDLCSLNYRTMAQVAWNATGVPLDRFWSETLARVFGPKAAPFMRTAFEHNRFDIRLDVVCRMIQSDAIERPYQFWDMYKLTRIDGLKDAWLEQLERDARQCADAVRLAIPLVETDEGRDLAGTALTAAERRLYLATSARAYVRAQGARSAGRRQDALREMRTCLAEAAKLERVATRLGIEYPMAVHDDEVVGKYREFASRLEAGHQQ